MRHDQDFGNTSVKAHVEPPGCKRNEFNRALGASIVACKHGLHDATYRKHNNWF